MESEPVLCEKCGKEISEAGSGLLEAIGAVLGIAAGAIVALVFLSLAAAGFKVWLDWLGAWVQAQ